MGNHRSDNFVNTLGKCKTNLIDRVGLDGWINEFGNKLALEVLPSSSIDTCLIFVRDGWLTSRKNFFAPTFRAFLRAASKSFETL